MPAFPKNEIIAVANLSADIAAVALARSASGPQSNLAITRAVRWIPADRLAHFGRRAVTDSTSLVPIRSSAPRTRAS